MHILVDILPLTRLPAAKSQLPMANIIASVFMHCELRIYS